MSISVVAHSLSLDAERVRQQRSRIIQTLNVPQRVRLWVFTRCGLAWGKGSLAREGWAGEERGRIEHPVGRTSVTTRGTDQ